MPKINGMFAGNLVPAAILFTGETCVGRSYYHKIQKRYLFPSIHKTYKTFSGGSHRKNQGGETFA